MTLGGLFRRASMLPGLGPTALTGLAIALGYLVLAVLHPLFAAAGKGAASRPAPPNFRHLFGTDSHGSDVLALIAGGAFHAVSLTAVAIAIAVLVGIPLGVIAGYAGGALDRNMLRIFLVVRAFPPVLLAVALVAAAGPAFWHTAWVVGLIEAPVFALAIRAEWLRLAAAGFVDAAIAAGNGVARLFLVHVMPNALGTVPATAAQRGGAVVVTTTTLAFLGLGAHTATPAWGTIMQQGVDAMQSGQWWIVVFPGLAALLLGFGLMLLGDGLGDRFQARREAAP